MTPEQKKYIFVQSTIGSAVVNAVLNGLLGLGATIGLTEFPMWKVPGVAGDYLATAFGVAFGTSLGAIVQIRLDMARGRISPPDAFTGVGAWAVRTPNGWLARAIVIGIVGLLIFGPPSIAALVMSGQTALPRGTFVFWKALMSAIEGAALTPFILLATLAKVPAVRKPA